nr:unnamed protein product [Callosobruchus analis]
MGLQPRTGGMHHVLVGRLWRQRQEPIRRRKAMLGQVYCNEK